MRAGTENIYAIAGMSKAMNIAYHSLSDHRKHMKGLKRRLIDGLTQSIAGVEFNGESANMENSLYTVLNVLFPATDIAEMLFYNLDILGGLPLEVVRVGSNIGSHVLNNIGVDMKRPSLRFSFSRFNTEEEIDYTIHQLKSLFS